METADLPERGAQRLETNGVWGGGLEEKGGGGGWGVGLGDACEPPL